MPKLKNSNAAFSNTVHSSQIKSYFSDRGHSNVRIVTYATPWIPTITDQIAKPTADSAHSAIISTLMRMLWKDANGVNEDPVTNMDKTLA